MMTNNEGALKQAAAGGVRPYVTVTDFKRDLAAAMDAESNPLVQAAIRQWFPRCLAVHRAHKENDCLGVDVWVEQPLARMTAVDLKIRSIDYGARQSRPMDAALEISYGKAPGWAMKSTATDVYLFVCIDTGRSAAFHADRLRDALAFNLDEWRGRFKTLTTMTASYSGKAVESKAICIPVDVLTAACQALGA
jgi:hypothetical protein